MKAVFDTNVLIAALLTEGVCSKLLIRARKRYFDLISCPFILQEVEQVLIKKFSVTPQETETALSLIIDAVQKVCHPDEEIPRVCRDADDDHILACAKNAKADYLVTGDGDLLSLENYEGTAIIRPRDFENLFVD